MRSTVCALFLVALTTALLRPAFFSAGPPLDEGRLLVFPERLLAGAVPVADFESIYPPGNDWLLAAVFAATRPSFKVERTVGLAYRLALVLGVFVVARRAGCPRRPAAACSRR